jgi:phage tail sheath protein FI
MTPGVYIEEKNAFSNSAVAVATAVPVFIGYTKKAERKGKSMLRIPVRISSYAEYLEIFGDGFNPRFEVAAVKKDGNQSGTPPTPPDPNDAKVVTFNTNAGGSEYTITPVEDTTLYLHSSIRLFFLNGGSDCYILSVGVYGDKTTFKVDLKHLGEKGENDVVQESVWKLLEKEQEPTMVLVPDYIALKQTAYNLYGDILKHCAKTQSRFGIFDLKFQTDDDTTDEIVTEFRTAIGTTALNYGAAYYPWLHTSIFQPGDVTYKNIAHESLEDLRGILPAGDGTQNATEGNIISEIWKNLVADDKKTLKPNITVETLHQSLWAASPTYKSLTETIRHIMNQLPPSGAIAGIYALVDSSRGVWKAPANVSVSYADGPTVNISHDQQEKLNVDIIAGKSINVIRPFQGIGTLVWGARTLDGNSQDWRYVNVRRTMIMIEQSLKLATRAYVFEPNDANTWTTVASMCNNFLTNLWKQGALAGGVPEQAFNVQIGLGSTMTPNDILDGIMKIEVKVAIVRPAEFIVITFQQLQQQS